MNKRTRTRNPLLFFILIFLQVFPIAFLNNSLLAMSIQTNSQYNSFLPSKNSPQSDIEVLTTHNTNSTKQNQTVLFKKRSLPKWLMISLFTGVFSVSLLTAGLLNAAENSPVENKEVKNKPNPVLEWVRNRMPDFSFSSDQYLVLRDLGKNKHDFDFAGQKLFPVLTDIGSKDIHGVLATSKSNIAESKMRVQLKNFIEFQTQPGDEVVLKFKAHKLNEEGEVLESKEFQLADLDQIIYSDFDTFDIIFDGVNRGGKFLPSERKTIFMSIDQSDAEALPQYELSTKKYIKAVSSGVQEATNFYHELKSDGHFTDQMIQIGIYTVIAAVLLKVILHQKACSLKEAGEIEEELKKFCGSKTRTTNYTKLKQNLRLHAQTIPKAASIAVISLGFAWLIATVGTIPDFMISQDFHYSAITALVVGGAIVLNAIAEPTVNRITRGTLHTKRNIKKYGEQRTIGMWQGYIPPLNHADSKVY